MYLQNKKIIGTCVMLMFCAYVFSYAQSFAQETDEIQKSIPESIEIINKTIFEIQEEKDSVLAQIKQIIKDEIDSSIIEIRKKTEKPAYELQRLIDSERTELLENITKKIDEISVGDSQKIEVLQNSIFNSLEKIKTSLEKESPSPLVFENAKRDIEETLSNFSLVLQQKNNTINSQEGNLVFKDSDADGLSDYDEIYIYKTDPLNAKTKDGDKTDGQKIAEGIDPLSDTQSRIQYQDPREDRTSYVSSTYTVKKVQLIKEDTQKLVFEGTALPNSFVTLYIYSTPIVVTVKTDESGQWSYQLEKELENGEHQIYVATVDNSGKIIARSNPILFTKSAEAAIIGISGSLESSSNAQNFLKDNFILITLAVLIAIVILTMMFVGNHRDIKSAVDDLKNQVN